MNEIIEKDNIIIENMIYEIRGKQVMLDSDLAKLYSVKTKRINEAVKNNPNKFPERFSFILSNNEKNNLWSKFSTANISNMSRSNPRVFTEQGVYMLATILKSKIATEVTIRIMDTLILMKKYISYDLIEQKYINNLVFKHDNEIKLLSKALNNFKEREKINTIFFDGQIYDAYSFLLDILSTSKNEIIIIDNYAGKELLDILKDINKNIIIVSSNINNILKRKYEKQYTNIKFINNNTFHDRFIIIDKSNSINLVSIKVWIIFQSFFCFNFPNHSTSIKTCRS